MEKEKNKTKKRIISVLLALPILLYALLVPIGAVVNSSQGTFKDFDLTAKSTFPLTVGFSYVTRDPDTGLGNTYVYATEVGGYGEEWNSTLFGQDTYTQTYVPAEGIEYDLEGSLTYNFVERVWNPEDTITWVDGDYTSSIRRGHQLMSIMNVAPSGGNIVGQQQGVVLRASDIVYNPAWYQVDNLGYGSTGNLMLPTFQTPSVENPSTEATVLTYSWRCTILSQNGNKYQYSGVQTYDTREDNASKMVPIIPLDVLKNFWKQSSIIISDYYGFIDIDYYENTAVEDDSLAGTWLINVPPELYTSEVEIFVEGSFYGLNEDQEMELLPLTELWWGYWDATNPEGEQSILSAYCGDRFANVDVTRTSFSSILEYIRCRFYAGTLIYEKRFDSTDEALLNLYRSINITTPYSEAVATNGEDVVNEFLSRLEGSATKQGSTNPGEPVWQEVDSSGDGYLFRFTYPLYDTSGVTITESNEFNESWKLFGTPTMQKYLSTTGEVPSPDYEADYSGWIGDAVGGFLNFELFPNFTLAGVIGILVSFSLVMLFLKFFAGG